MDWPLAGTVETQVAVETNVSQSLPLILRVTAAAKSDDSRIVMIQPDTIRLNYEKCPERDLRIVTIENGTDASKRLELSCNLEGVSFALTGEKSHPLLDHTFSQFERTYRVRLPVGTVTGTQLGSISFRFGPTIGTAPLSRSMLIEVARQ